MPAVNVTDPVHGTLELLEVLRPLGIIRPVPLIVIIEVEETSPSLLAGKLIVNWAP